MMSDKENILNDDGFFAYDAVTPKEGMEQHRKQECLTGAISKGKLLGKKGQWTHQGVDKASNKTISKVYVEYKQRELNEN